MSGHITKAGSSILDEIDLDPAYIVKAKLAQRIARSITDMGLSQRDAADMLPVTLFIGRARSIRSRALGVCIASRRSPRAIH